MPKWPTISEGITRATKVFFENMWAATEEGDTAVAASVTEETQAREGALSVAEAARVNGDSAVAATVTSEKAAREAAVKAEKEARESAITALAAAAAAAVSAEEAARIAADATKLTQTTADGRYGRYPELPEVANVTAAEFTLSSAATVHFLTLKVNAVTIHPPAEATLGTSHFVYLLQDVSGNRIPTFSPVQWPEKLPPANFSIVPEAKDLVSLIGDGLHWTALLVGVNIG